jgi:predicted Zn finger-like uncharacterized protein
MSIPIRCPSCSTTFQVAENLQGKRLRCKHCQHILSIPAAPTPLSIPEPEEVQPERTVPLGLVLGIGGGGLVLLLGLIGLIVWLTASGRDEEPTRFADLGPGRFGEPENVVKEDPKNKPGPFKVKTTNPEVKPPDPVVKPPLQNPPPKPPVVTPPPPPKTDTWDVKPDPSAQTFALPANATVSVPIPRSRSGYRLTVLYPGTPSPFVGVSLGSVADDEFHVWNLLEGKQTGTLKGPVNQQDILALSPDGKHVAGIGRILDKNLNVWAVADQKQVHKLKLDSSMFGASFLNFTGPDQVVAMVRISGNEKIQVWDIAQGKMLRQIDSVPGGYEANTQTLSPGGRYLALAARDGVTIFDLTQGKLVEKLKQDRLEGFEAQNCRNLAFAPDGSELAALYQFGYALRITSWSMETGKVAVDHSLPGDAWAKMDQGAKHHGQALEWLPDRSGWMVKGNGFFDYKHGNLVYQSAPAADHVMGPRRLLGGEQLLVVSGSPIEGVKIKNVPLPREQIATAIQNVKPPAVVAPANTLTLTPADWSAVRRIPAATGATTAAVALDPAPPAPSKLGAQPIPLKFDPDDVLQVRFALPGAGKASVMVKRPSAQVTVEMLQIHRYDLATGAALGGMDLMGSPRHEAPFTSFLSDLGPDGALFALRDPRNPRRVDVWSLAENKHLAGWLPFEKEAGTDAEVSWIALLEGARLLTANAAGKLVLWSVPECKAVYAIESGCRHPLALSPGRKHLAAFNGKTFDYLDAATGERRGQLPQPPNGVALTSSTAASFSLDGRLFAAVMPGQGAGAGLIVWNLQAGKVETMMPLPGTASEIKWCGAQYLLLDDRDLLSLERQWVFWRYTAPGRVVAGSPDGRHWFVGPMQLSNDSQLRAQTLPNPAAVQFLATPESRLSQQQDQRSGALGGQRVSLRMNVTGLINVSEVRDQITSDLKQKGIEVSATAPAVLSIQATETDTGRSQELVDTSPVGGAKKRFNVPIKNLTCNVSLTTADGKVTWSARRTFTNELSAFGSVFTFGGEEPATALRKRMWKEFENALLGRGIQPLMEVGQRKVTFDLAEGVKYGLEQQVAPRTTMLTGDR